MSDMCVDKKEVKDIVEGETALVKSEINGKFNLIDEKIDTLQATSIKTLQQTTLTNSRVTTLERKTDSLEQVNLNKISTCPHRERIRSLEDARLELNTVKRVIWTAFGALAGLIVAITAILALIY